MNIASYIDHTNLQPTATAAQIKQLCEEAISHNFAAVCVPLYHLPLAQKLTANTKVKVATVVGFPLGYNNTEAKVAEVNYAISNGADEIDMVQNIAAVKDANWEYLAKEIVQILQPIRLHNKCLKVIVESGLLTNEELIKCCELYAKHKVDFVKTSTGYSPIGATIEAVKIMRTHLPEGILIKASGGIREAEFAKQLIAAGANRIGTSSGVAMMK